MRNAEKIAFFGICIVILLCGCVNNQISDNTSSPSSLASSTVYLIYSPTCPHCHELRKYLASVNTNVKIVETTEAGKFYRKLKQLGVEWDGGVPLLFAVLKNNTVIAIEGYPAAQQEVNGYFLGREKEIEICNSLKGRSVYIGGEYKFCILPSGIILGNRYAVDYLLEICGREKCKEIE